MTSCEDRSPLFTIFPLPILQSLSSTTHSTAMVLNSPLAWGSAKDRNLQEPPLRLRPVYTFALFANVICMSVASWIRFLNGWSYEDAGLWLNMAFWGSGAATLGLLAMHSWAFLHDMEVSQAHVSQGDRPTQGIESYHSIIARRSTSKALQGMKRKHLPSCALRRPWSKMASGPSLIYVMLSIG
jgi:hypothetical protein